MDKKTLLQEIGLLSEQADQLKNFDNEIREATLKKANLEKEIKILTTSLAEMKDKHDKAVKYYDEEIKFKQNLINELQDKQSKISSVNSLEISRLEQLRNDVQASQSKVISDRNNHDKNISLFNMDKKVFEEKLRVVEKIKELAKGL